MHDLDSHAVPQTGQQFLDSLNDGREVWIYGEKVRDVTAHPAFRNAARSLSALYDAMHDPAMQQRLLVPTDTGNGGVTHAAFRTARDQNDLRAQREAMRCWQELVFGWMGRTPDYKAAFLAGMGADPAYFGDYAPNVNAWYKRAQEGVLHLAHAIINPPVDRNRPLDEVGDVIVHVEKETDAGIIVSGAKVVATGAPTTQHVFVAHSIGIVRDKKRALAFIAPLNGPGTKLICRPSYEFAATTSGSPWDYPLSSRLDENDAILFFESTLIPWENVLVYDVDIANSFNADMGWESQALLQSITRMEVKMTFLAGALSKALDITGAGVHRGVEAALGEVISYRNLVTGVRDGMIENARPGFGGWMTGDLRYGKAYAAIAPRLYIRIREIMEIVVASGLIYLHSNACDLMVPELRPTLDKYLRGTGGRTAEERSKTMKLLWDAIGSEFGARHELYEMNYFGSYEINHLETVAISRANGDLDRMRAMVDRCMSQYDMKGWTDPRFVQPGDHSVIGRR